MNYEIKFEKNPSNEDIQILGNGIDEFSKTKIARGDKIYLTYFLRDTNGQIV